MPKRGKAMANWGRRKRRRCRWEPLIYLNQIKMPQRGLRSSLPGIEHESVNKKGLQLYAIFFASVWCIKGILVSFFTRKMGLAALVKLPRKIGLLVEISLIEGIRISFAVEFRLKH
ncbi:unnamed protein product [Musa hybrid cultivar]